MFEQNIERGSQGHSQRGEMDECPHVMDWRKKLAPELQTDDCFATGVTLCYGIALVKPKESVTISTLIFRKAPILGRSYGDPTPPPSRRWSLFYFRDCTGLPDHAAIKKFDVFIWRY